MPVGAGAAWYHAMFVTCSGRPGSALRHRILMAVDAHQVTTVKCSGTSPKIRIVKQGDASMCIIALILIQLEVIGDCGFLSNGHGNLPVLLEAIEAILSANQSKQHCLNWSGHPTFTTGRQ